MLSFILSRVILMEKERFNLEKKLADFTEIQTVSTGNEAWVCDINTGVCGPVSASQETTEPIQVDFFKTVKKNNLIKNEDHE